VPPRLENLVPRLSGVYVITLQLGSDLWPSIVHMCRYSEFTMSLSLSSSLFFVYTYTHHRREIQLQQMHKATSSSIGITTNNLLTALTESSFTLPFMVVISVAILLLLCRQRRPRYYTLSRNASHVSLGRTTSHMSLGRNQSSSRLSIIAATSGSSNTSFYLKGAG